jgi:type VI secretion system protein ImpM
MIFGKLPSHGDFVARGLSGPERAELDRWLSASMADAREQLGEGFAEAFDAALPWLFAWDEGSWTAGAMAPSVDSAGRRFPLIVALRGLDSAAARAASERCEEAIFAAVAECWSADKFAEELSSVSVEAGPSDTDEGWWRKDVGDLELRQRLPPEILTRMIGAPVGATR